MQVNLPTLRSADLSTDSAVADVNIFGNDVLRSPLLNWKGGMLECEASYTTAELGGLNWRRLLNFSKLLKVQDLM